VEKKKKRIIVFRFLYKEKEERTREVEKRWKREIGEYP